jgi:hypothetical protein
VRPHGGLEVQIEGDGSSSPPRVPLAFSQTVAYALGEQDPSGEDATST